MAKVHARLSIEIDLTDEEFRKIVESAKDKSGNICDTEIPNWVTLNNSKITQCDWDDGGYIPGPWLEEDIRYEREANGVEV